MDLRQTRNRLLQRLTTADRARLSRDFTLEPLVFKQELVEQGHEVEHVYFVEGGVASMLTDLDDGSTIETGTVGNEGLVGLSAVLGDAPSPGRVIIQIPGSGWRASARMIQREQEQNTEWFRVLL